MAPGIVPTDLFAAAGHRRAARTTWRGAGVDDAAAPVRARPADIGAVVAFLLSQDAAYMTGQVVSVDGGATFNEYRPPVGRGRNLGRGRDRRGPCTRIAGIGE